MQVSSYQGALAKGRLRSDLARRRRFGAWTNPGNLYYISYAGNCASLGHQLQLRRVLSRSHCRLGVCVLGVASTPAIGLQSASVTSTASISTQVWPRRDGPKTTAFPECAWPSHQTVRAGNLRRTQPPNRQTSFLCSIKGRILDIRPAHHIEGNDELRTCGETTLSSGTAILAHADGESLAVTYTSGRETGIQLPFFRAASRWARLRDHD